MILGRDVLHVSVVLPSDQWVSVFGARTFVPCGSGELMPDYRYWYILLHSFHILVNIDCLAMWFIIY